MISSQRPWPLDHEAGQFCRCLVGIISGYGARGGAVGWGTALQPGRSRVRIPMELLEFFHWRTFSGGTMALESTRSLTGMSKGCRCVGLTTLPPLWSPWSSWSQSIGHRPNLAREFILSDSWNSGLNDDNTVNVYVNFIKPLKCHVLNTDSCFLYYTFLLLLTHGDVRQKHLPYLGGGPIS